MRTLNSTVYPSNEQSIEVEDDPIYGGAHRYFIRDCLGFNNGKIEYGTSHHTFQFIQKLDDGSVIPGSQSEQIVLALLDRHQKLNDRFPSKQYIKMKEGLEMFLEACKERVDDRINRGVMGDLKK